MPPLPQRTNSMPIGVIVAIFIASWPAPLGRCSGVLSPVARVIAAAVARTTGDDPPLRLPSGAGHDAMKMAAIAPVGMLFVRCGNGGISHHPDETLSEADADVEARAFCDFLRNFGC